MCCLMIKVSCKGFSVSRRFLGNAFQVLATLKGYCWRVIDRFALGGGSVSCSVVYLVGALIFLLGKSTVPFTS